MKKKSLALILSVLLICIGVGFAFAANPNPRVIPSKGSLYADLSAQWWQWAMSFPAEDVPYLNTGGQVDVGAGQSGNIWFLAGSPWGVPTLRTGEVPAGTSLFFPLANLLNDYPCPDPGFQPDPDETLEEFLQRTGNEWVGDLTDLYAEIDGVALRNLNIYRTTSSLFQFTADPALAQMIDPCITGTLQDGVSIGYWLLLPPLVPGVHTLHFGCPAWGQDSTYTLIVAPGR